MPASVSCATTLNKANNSKRPHLQARRGGSILGSKGYLSNGRIRCTDGSLDTLCWSWFSHVPFRSSRAALTTRTTLAAFSDAVGGLYFRKASMSCYLGTKDNKGICRASIKLTEAIVRTSRTQPRRFEVYDPVTNTSMLCKVRFTLEQQWLRNGLLKCTSYTGP